MKPLKFILMTLTTGGVFAGTFISLLGQTSGAGRGLSARWMILALSGVVFILLAVMMYRRRATMFGAAGAKISGKADIADRHGFSYQPKADTAFRRSFSDVPGIPDSGKARHLLRGMIAGREAVIFEHMYMVYNGTSMMPIQHTIFSTDAPDWPRLVVSSRSLLSRLSLRMGWGAGLQLENTEFNRRFRIKTSDDDFALTLLSPDMQHFIASKPRVKWDIRPGRLCLVYSGPLRFGGIERSLERVERFWSLVPEELESWSS